LIPVNEPAPAPEPGFFGLGLGLDGMKRPQSGPSVIP